MVNRLRASSEGLNQEWLPESAPLASRTKEKESVMFARRIYVHLKTNSVAEFTQRLEKDVLPLLRKQKGFQDEITFVGQGGTEAFAISLWDTAENAEAYNRGTYPEVTKILATVVEGAPQVETYDVANSTFHKIAAAAAA
jgi:heme-degrading monooxygenase HmoA